MKSSKTVQYHRRYRLPTMFITEFIFLHVRCNSKAKIVGYKCKLFIKVAPGVKRVCKMPYLCSKSG